MSDSEIELIKQLLHEQKRATNFLQGIYMEQLQKKKDDEKKHSELMDVLLDIRGDK